MFIPSLLRDSPYRKIPEIDRLAQLLLPPFEPNHFKGHSVVQPLLAKELRRTAKAYERGNPELGVIVKERRV